jgi:UDP-glucose:(heptosyl)LPS alpha-1,3-glucosyltransferase
MNREGELPAGMRLVMAPGVEGNSVSARRKFASFVKQHLAQSPCDVVIGFNRLPGLDYYFAADTCFAWKATRERNFFYRWAPRSRQYQAFEKAVFGAQSDTRIFMLSPLQKQEYLACYPAAQSRITDIPPGIARDRMAPDNAEDIRNNFRQEFNIAADDIVLMQVGTGYPVKGVDRSLAAIAALPPALQGKLHFLVLGTDRHGGYAKQAAQLGITARIVFMEGRNDLPRFLQGADLLLQPSRKESAGMVILEAIVAGLPVLATATCGYAFHVEKAGAGNIIPEPFSQQGMDAMLLAMLTGSDRPRWRDNGIHYGREGDFYAMPDRVAEIIMASGTRRGHGN